MVIGSHQPRRVRETDLRAALLIGLDEAFTALEEAIHDLSDVHVRSFPIPGRVCIAWIVMHSLQNVDTDVVHTLSYDSRTRQGRRAAPRDPRWDLWQAAEHERPQSGEAFPTVAELRERLRMVRRLALAEVERRSVEQLHEPVMDWWPAAGDPCMRAICHLAAHVRQIWLLRGALGLIEGDSWPRQHWA